MDQTNNQLDIFNYEKPDTTIDIYFNGLGMALPWEEESVTIQEIELKLEKLRKEYLNPPAGKSRDAIKLQAMPYKTLLRIKTAGKVLE